MEWTQEQERAIHTPTGTGNILVSAAAGSGKTAVLVERILQKIIRNEAAIDRLLVVTFTEAAAAEMREKIIKRLTKEMDNPSNSEGQIKLLKRQVQLAQTADIMTIDAFCNRVVQNNFHVLGADPDVSIIDSAMEELLREEAMESLFARMYKNENTEEHAAFERLIDVYASNRDDKGLAKIIHFVYKFVMSFADPAGWLDSAAENYRLPVSEMPVALYYEEVSRRAAARCAAKLDEFIGDAKDENLLAYARELKSVAASIRDAKDWDDIYEIYDRLFKKKKGKPKIVSIVQTQPEAKEPENKQEQERLRFIRQELIDSLNDGITVSRGAFEEACDSGLLYEEASDLVWLVKEFMKEYAALKDKNSVREFSDIEHMTYELFHDHEGIRSIYSDKYDEILIDEYQDTNGLQDAIFNMISHNNIFMVGDLKQSIYRFRGGDPYIFRDKSDKYMMGESEDKKLVLSQNFRSRREILNSVNDVFGCIMSREAGDVEYTGTERIVRLKDYYPKPETDLKSELHYLMVRNSAETDKGMEEIRFTADKIKELLESGAKVYDKDTGQLRPIRKKDIVILQNSVKSNGEDFVKALSDRGIDAFTETETFFSRREINVMLSLISVINNARQDIPLLAVMRSPIGGFTEDELARIRLSAPESDNFISAVRSFAATGGLRLNKAKYIYKGQKTNADLKKRDRRTLTKKCYAFIENLKRWRGYVRSKSVAQLIWTIYEETYFYDMMGAIEQGEEAQFNLRLLYERARQYENAGFKGLFNFIKYIEQIEGSDEDLGGAKLIGENHDVVRIMTIHKSKGLEFPYVFVCGAGKKFRTAEDVSIIRLHKELGIGLPYIYYDEHYTRDTKIKETIAQINKNELTAERMRLLYVALTRAREKLYVIASVNTGEDVTEEALNDTWKSKLSYGKMLPSVALTARGFFDWMCPAAYASPETWRLVYHDITAASQDEEPKEDEEQETFEDSPELRKAVYEILDYSYPYSESSTIPSRASVTQLKELTIERMSAEDSAPDTPVYEPDSRRTANANDMADLMFSPLHPKPAFMREKGDKPANEIGTLYHLVMSELNLDIIRKKGADCVKDGIERLVREEKIAEEDVKYIDIEKIKGFYESDIGKRLLSSTEIHREQPFQINIPATEYDPSLAAEYAEEKLILQGIIDCYFKEADGYVLLDYKTDKVRNNKEEIRRKYDKQLELYKTAIESLTGRMVKESVLYLFDIGETV
ncbi:MAG: helicase-exonuclease AddAB subunit AddA [Candidatus Ornithomonoglobus sp.]